MTQAITSKKLFEILDQYKSFPFIFVEPGGNYGDSLIYQGAEKIFNLARICYKKVNHPEFMALEVPHDTAVYINGSGAFNAMYHQRPIDELKKALASSAKAVILGPTTFTQDSHFLKDGVFSRMPNNPDKKTFIFCREKISYSTLNKIIPSHFELLLDHDTALNLHAEDLIKHVPKGKYVLYGIREDKEKLGPQRPDLLTFWVDPVPYCSTYEDWIALHANAEKVITNRLHSSILSSILGKSVTLLPNSYYKNRCVWEYSLKDKGVLWKDTIEHPGFISFLLRFKPYKKFINSYKIRKLFRRL